MNSNQNWELKIDAKIDKILAKFPKKDAEKIVTAIDFLIQNPYFGDIEKIKGEEYTWRRRIGNYRLFYDIKQRERTIIVTWIERRKSHTY